MKVLRSTLFVAAAVVTAACGDKVTVQGPTSTTPSVHSVSVAPTTATLNINQAITMSAAVTADAGATVTPIAWTSSDPSKVSVSGTTTSATVTGLAATPGVAVCAAVGGATGCATVVVTGASAVIPATVSIASITLGGNINAPVNPGNVVGGIDVRVNVSPGNETVNKVVLLVGATRADSQTFSAAQSAALRSVADQAIAEQSAFPPILFSVNTAKFNATTGVPAWINGSYVISVQLYVAGNTAARATATSQTPLIFNNVDTYLATFVTSGTVAFVNSATGFRYDKGSVSATVLPISYAGKVVAGGTLLFGSACDANGTGQRNIALTAPVAPSTAWTATLPAVIPSGGAIVNTVNNYEFTNNGLALCNALNPIGETIAVTATDGNGDALFAAAAPVNANAVTSLRLDNRAPQVGSPTLVANPNNRNNGWVNAAIALVSSNTSATSNGIVINPATTACAGGAVARDCGEGSYVRFARIANATGGLVDDARAATAAAAPTLPGRSLTPTTYCVIITAQDALGNETARPAAGTACTVPPAGASTGVAANHMEFGVDLDAPTIALVGSATVATALDNNERRNVTATVTNAFTVAVADTGTIGNSGMLSGSSVVGTVQLRNDAAVPALTVAQKCVIGALDANNVCQNASVGGAPAAGGLVATGAAVTGSALTGYYTYVGAARDAAGNSSATVTRVIGYNPAANVPALTTALFNVPLTGSTAVFNANASTNFDIWNSTYSMAYAGAGLAGPILYVPALLNTFNGTQLFSNVAAGITLTGFMRQVELVTGNAPLATGGGFKPSGLTGVVRDQANIPSAAAVTAIPGASVTNGVLYSAAAVPTLARSWAITNAAVNVSTGAGPAAAVNGLSVTLNADAFGPTATFNPPFIRVDFYASIGGNLEQIGSSTALSTVDDGTPFGRRHRFSITWTPGVNSPISNTPWVLGAQNLFAIGVNANGDALVTQVSAVVTLTNP